MGSLTKLDHLPFVPESWQDFREWVRKASITINGILNGGPFPARWGDYVADINSARVAGANTPTWRAMTDSINAYSFSNTSMNEVWLTVHINHDYKRGTNLYPHVHWAPDNTNTGTVRWGIEYTIAKGHNQAAFPASTTIYIEQAGPGTALQHMIAEASDGQAFDGLEPDTLLMMRAFRDAAHANDTYAGTNGAFGLYVDIHYQQDRRGTVNKAPNFYE